MSEALRPRDVSKGALAEVEARISSHFVSPAAARDDEAISRDPSADRGTVLRPAYLRDVEKILHTPAYNRLAGKTQVFSFSANDDITRRGLHVQLVARVARDIGRALGLNLDLIEAIGLGHDIGHTPFGHAGEHYLNDLLQAQDGRWFFHNAQSVRVLDALYHRNVSLQTLDGILAHNGEDERRTFGTEAREDFDSLDADMARAIREGPGVVDHLVPMTIEGCVVRVSDIIAYVGKDRADAITAHHVTADDFAGGLGGAYNSLALERFIGDVVENSLEGTALPREQAHIAMSEEAFAELKAAKRENYEKIYLTTDLQSRVSDTVRELFGEVFGDCMAALAAGDEDHPIFRHHIAVLERQSGYYGRAYDWDADHAQTCADYIASMSDEYFMALAERLDPALCATLPRHPHFEDD